MIPINTIVINKFESIFNVAINTNPKLMRIKPMNVKISEPILSDKLPLKGATTVKSKGSTIIINPVCSGV
ncbi:hypothetical protein CBEIJ_52760 [Clostridium beijerinckii]|nr:hypothetical protein CBEIJ_52760 [Clostridium beijerinckii]